MLRRKETESPPPTFQPAQAPLRKRLRPNEPLQRHQQTLRTCLQRNPEITRKTITDQRVTQRLGLFGNAKKSQPAFRVRDLPAPIKQRIREDIQKIVNSVHCERAEVDDRQWAFAPASEVTEQQQPLLKRKRIDDDRPRKQPRFDFIEAETSQSTTVTNCDESRVTTQTFCNDTDRPVDGRRRSTFPSDPPFYEIAERILKVVPFLPLQQGKGETYATAARRIVSNTYFGTNSGLLKTDVQDMNTSATAAGGDSASVQVDDRQTDWTIDDQFLADSDVTMFGLGASSTTAAGDFRWNDEPRPPLIVCNECVFRSPYRPYFARSPTSPSQSQQSSVGTQPFSLDVHDESFGNEYNLYSIMEEFEPCSPPYSPPPPSSSGDRFGHQFESTDDAGLVLF